jgi:hypothetical protein
MGGDAAWGHSSLSLHPVSRIRMLEMYFHSLMHLHGTVLNCAYGQLYLTTPSLVTRLKPLFDYVILAPM